MLRTSNPALNAHTFETFSAYESPAVMTLEGTATKTGLLVVLTAFAAACTWRMLMGGNAQAAMPWVMGGAITGLIIGFVTVFKKEWSAVTAPMYAAAEGLVLGAISALAEMRYPGIAFQAVCLTFGTLFSLLVAYRSGLIRATENFKLGVFAATGGICLIYFVTFLLALFGVRVPYIHEAGLIGIAFSLFVVVIAALNLVLDFDFIETGVARGAPKYMEWYAAFGLLVTLIWLYIEILRLLGKLRDRK